MNVIMSQLILNISLYFMSNSKKVDAQAVSVSDFYSRYLKESIIHKRQIIQHEIEGSKYLFTYGQKKGDWYYSDCILVVYSNPQGKLFFGFARVTNGFPILEKVQPIFKRYLPIQQLKDVKSSKDKELHVLIQGYGDQSLWKFRFYVEQMIQKWSELLIRLRFHNHQRKEVDKIFNIKGQGQALNKEKIVHKKEGVVKQANGEQLLAKEGQNSKTARIDEAKINQANKSEILYKSKISELQKQKSELKNQLQLRQKAVEPKSQVLASKALESQALLKSKIIELQKQKNQIRAELELTKKQKNKIAQELLQRSRLDKEAQERQKILSANALQIQMSKKKFTQAATGQQQYQVKYANLKKQSQAAMAVLNHEKDILVQKNNQIIKLKQQIKNQLQIAQKQHQKTFFQLKQENKLCKEKIVQIHKAKQALALQLSNKVSEHEKVIFTFKEHQKANQEKVSQLQRRRDQILLELQIQRKEQENRLNQVLEQNRQIKQAKIELQNAKSELALQLQAKQRQNVKIYAQLTQQNKLCKDEIVKLQTIISKVERQFQNFKISHQQALSHLGAEKSKIEQQRMQEREVNKEQIVEKQACITQLKAQFDDQTTKLLSKKQQIVSVQKEVQNLQKQNTKLIIQTKQKQSLIEKTSADNQKVQNTHKRKIQQLDRKVEELQKKNIKLNQAIQALKLSVLNQEERNAKSNQTIRNISFSNQKLQLQLQGTRNKIKFYETQIGFMEAQLEASKASSLAQLIKVNAQSSENHLQTKVQKQPNEVQQELIQK